MDDPADTPDNDARAASPGIAREDLIVHTAIPGEQIDRYVAAGLISGPRWDKLYAPGHVTRVRLIAALEGSGIPLRRLTAAVAGGKLSLDFAGIVMADEPHLSHMTVAEACAAHGISVEDFRRQMLATGAAASPTDQPIREDDLELLQLFVAARDRGLPTDVVLGLQRSFALGVRRIVETQRELFRQYVEEPMLAAGLPYAQVFERAAEARIALQSMGYRTTFLLQRRFIERVVYDNLVARFEEALDSNNDERTRAAPLHSICFIDLSGFTQRTERLGDDHAATLASALVEIAQVSAAHHRGQLVKALGDGTMLHFPKAEDAIRCALDIVRQTQRADLPAARAGISTGPVITRDGDYYGRAVNRAARLLGIATPNQVLVTNETISALSTPDFAFDHLGPVALKGIDDAVHAFAARTASAVETSRP